MSIIIVACVGDTHERYRNVGVFFDQKEAEKSLTTYRHSGVPVGFLEAWHMTASGSEFIDRHFIWDRRKTVFR